jgi:RNA polymerase sigma-70 factor (ECF subfamily)
MTAEEFQQTFRGEIAGILGRISRRYSVTDQELIQALYSSVKRHMARSEGDGRKSVAEYLSSLNHEELCLALACAKGDESAWEDFFREYRSYMISVARSMTQDAAEAQQLADSTFAELYGLREIGGERVSKFSFYSGLGSLRGWLRAVMFQLSTDMHRKIGRFVQAEEAGDLDQLVGHVSGKEIELDFISKRYNAAVSEALRRAIQELEPRERLILAYYYCDQMTLRQIGELFSVHESTISRWLTKAQKKTRKLVEKSLLRDHGFTRREAAEAMELAAQRADIGVAEYLFELAPSDQKASRT